MGVIDTRRPIGAMNEDTEDRLLPPTHVRYAKNGRSVGSDKDGSGSVEGIRGNKLRHESFDKRGQVIGSCSDIKNNSVIDFIAGDEIDITYTTGSVNFFPAYIEVTGASSYLAIGNRIRVKQSITEFVCEITSISGNKYYFTLVSGTYYDGSISQLTWLQYNYIRRWKSENNTFENLTNPKLMSDALGFTLTDRIYNARVLESPFGQLLAWVSKENGEPCLMNIDRMKYGGEYYSTASDVYYIRLAKRPMLMKPTVTAVDYGGKTNLKGTGYQFCVVYEYDDNQKSVLSPYSDIVFVEGLEDAINVTFYTGHKTVKRIKILVREGNGVSDTGVNNPNWYEIYTIKDNIVPEGTTQIDYTGIEQRTAISRIESDKLFESIPEYANAIEVTNTNQIALADITEGKDNITIADDTTGIVLEPEEPGVYATPTTLLESTFDSTSTGIISAPLLPATFPCKVHTPATVLKNLIIFNDNKSIGYSTDFADEISVRVYGSMVQKILFWCNTIESPTPSMERATFKTILVKNGLDIYVKTTTFFPYATNTPTSLSETVSFDWNISIKNSDKLELRVDIDFINPAGITWKVEGSIDSAAGSSIDIDQNYVNKKTFKENSSVEIGIAYYDEYLRTGGVIPLGKADFTPIETGLLPAGGDVYYYRRLKVNIYTRPPIWAKYYSILNKETPYNYGWVTGKSWALAVGGLEVVYDEIPSDFTFTQGNCFARVIGQQDSGYNGSYEAFPVGQYNDLLVSGIDTSTKKITLNGVWEFPTSDYIIIELYDKKPPSSYYFENKFFEIGDAGKATRYHKTDWINQSSSDPTGTPARLRITGDNYIRYVGQFYGYSKSYNGAYESNYWDKGRPLIYVPNMSQKRIKNMIRWGNRLIENTMVNNLSQWDEGNYVVLPNKHGAITGMRIVGYTLKIVQETNYSTAFIGRRELQNTDGTTNIIVTDNLIGTINPSSYEYGSKYHGSIISTGNRVYFFDSLKGKYVVDDGNGINEVAILTGVDGSAGTTMSKYWRGISNKINNNSDYEIITGFDYLYRDMYVTILNRTLNSQETIYYNELQNAWKYFIDMEHTNQDGSVKYIPDMYSSVGNILCINMKGNLFEFNKSDNMGEETYCELFKINPTDPIKPLVIETIGMLEPDKVKVFLNHIIHSNKAPTQVEIIVPKSDMYPNGMYTILYSSNYKYREGVFYGDIKRDAYTKGYTVDAEQLKTNIANGRPMRGHVCLVRITFSTNQYVKVLTTGINMIASEMS